jgi:iron(III) transport system ATP-binding protein
MSHLEVRHLTKTYPQASHAAVSDVSLDLQTGQVLALVGESGSGKTTLLRLLAGLETPDAGVITLGSRAISSPQQVIEPEARGVGLVFQHHALFPHLTVASNVGFGLRQHTSTERRAIVQDLLKLAGLAGKEHRYPHELSGGERQRVALVRSLAPQPQLLLLDEPFSSLDTGLRQAVRDETRAILRARNATAIFVTHDTSDALAVADQVIVLRHGLVQQTGTPHAIYHAPSSAYVARFFSPCNRIPLTALPGCEHRSTQTLSSISQAEESHALWTRPDQLQLVPVNATTDLLTGIVSRVSFSGEYEQVWLHCEHAGEHFDLLIHHRQDFPVATGEQWAIRWRN